MTDRAALGSAFNRPWTAMGAANLADGMALFLLPVMAVKSGASPGGVAAVTVAVTAAWPIFGLHAGWIVDRVNRAKLLVIVNVVRAVTLGALMGLQLQSGLTPVSHPCRRRGAGHCRDVGGHVSDLERPPARAG